MAPKFKIYKKMQENSIKSTRKFYGFNSGMILRFTDPLFVRVSDCDKKGVTNKAVYMMDGFCVRGHP